MCVPNGGTASEIRGLHARSFGRLGVGSPGLCDSPGSPERRNLPVISFETFLSCVVDSVGGRWLVPSRNENSEEVKKDVGKSMESGPSVHPRRGTVSRRSVAPERNLGGILILL